MPLGDQTIVITAQGSDEILLYDHVSHNFKTWGLNNPTLGSTYRHIKMVGVDRSGLGTSNNPAFSHSARAEQIVGGYSYYLLVGPFVWTSSDTGKTWGIDTAGLSGKFVNDIAVDTSGTLYGTTGAGLFFEPPDSTSWRPDSTFTLNNNLSKVFVDKANRIFLAGSSGGVYISADNGGSWSVDSIGLGSLSPTSFGEDAYGNIYAVTASGVYKSSGGTGPWTEIDAGISALAGTPPTINVVNGDSVLYAGTSVGLFASTDQGTTWIQADSGIQAESFYGIAENHAGRILLSSPLGIYARNASDTSWTKVFPSSGLRDGLPLYADGLDNFYTILSDASTPSIGIVQKSTDAGATWAPDSNGISSTQYGVFYVDELGVQHIASSLYGISFFDVIYDKPVGGSWMLDTAGFHIENNSYASCLVSNRQGWLYLSGYFVYPFTVLKPRVLRRPIKGGAWSVDTVGLPSSVTTFSSFAADANGIVYGRAFSSIYARETDGWTRIPFPSGLGTASVMAISCDSGNALWAAFETFAFPLVIYDGVYYTTDKGTTWTHAGLDSVPVNSITCFGDTAYVITDEGVFSLTRSPATGVKDRPLSLPQQVALDQAYPNPFNPSAIIRYQLPYESKVTLKVYNVLGELAATLREGVVSAGYKQETWNASGFASGVYFYRLEATSVADPYKIFSQVKKMVLVK
jgi:photosystem II stability/assembly factor-like uncharacterized protein